MLKWIVYSDDLLVKLRQTNPNFIAFKWTFTIRIQFRPTWVSPLVLDNGMGHKVK